MKKSFFVLALVSTLGFSAAHAAPAAGGDKPAVTLWGFLMKGGKVQKVMSDGASQPLEREMLVAGGTKVEIDGTLKLRNGKTLLMTEGEFIIHDGTTAVTFKRGDTYRVLTDGKLVPLRRELLLLDGSKARKDGSVLRPDGSTLQLGEGDSISAGGVLTKAGK